MCSWRITGSEGVVTKPNQQPFALRAALLKERLTATNTIDIPRCKCGAMPAGPKNRICVECRRLKERRSYALNPAKRLAWNAEYRQRKKALRTPAGETRRQR